MRRTPNTCSCGESYARTRTGLSFREVRAMMRVSSDDPKDWRSKSRRAVLGHWHEIKMHLWEQIHGHCR